MCSTVDISSDIVSQSCSISFGGGSDAANANSLFHLRSLAKFAIGEPSELPGLRCLYVSGLEDGGEAFLARSGEEEGVLVDFFGWARGTRVSNRLRAASNAAAAVLNLSSDIPCGEGGGSLDSDVAKVDF